MNSNERCDVDSRAVSSSSESDSSDSEPTPKKKTIVKPKAKETAPLEKVSKSRI